MRARLNNAPGFHSSPFAGLKAGVANMDDSYLPAYQMAGRAVHTGRLEAVLAEMDRYLVLELVGTP